MALQDTGLLSLSHPTYQPTVRVFKAIALYYQTVQGLQDKLVHTGQHPGGGGAGVSLPLCKYTSFTSMFGGVSLIEIASNNFDFNIISWN